MVAASSKRCWSTSRANRAWTPETAGRTSLERAERTVRDHRARTSSREIDPSHGAQQRPIPARAQAAVGRVGLSRGVHCRIGKPS